MKKLKGRIVDISRGTGGFRYIIQGIKKDYQPTYDKNYYGSNGTYLGADNTYPVIYAKVSVYDFENKTVDVDIREVVFQHYEWARINDGRIDILKERLVGKKITIIDKDDEYTIENIESML